ncbi:MAG: peptidoglycan DD-metalloendopeptidase family protein [Oscillospiraceae bacterium]|nr:peptidoglycan DD-metalloendopeptidase family protein [Oscillospiraceae bacterium]
MYSRNIPTQIASKFQQIRKSNYLLPVSILLLLLLSLTALIFTQFTVQLYVRMDGESIGTVPDTETLDQLIVTTEEAVGDILGSPFEIEDRLSYSLRIVHVNEAESVNLDSVEQSIFQQIDEIDMHYVVSVDGNPVGYIARRSDLRGAMEARLNQLVDEGVQSAAFLSEVEFEAQYIDLDSKLDPAGIETLVMTLSVETVEQIAYTESIPYAVDVILDDTRLIEDTQILREGTAGKMEILAQITSVDGKEILHTILKTEVLTDSVSEIVLLGTLERPLTASFGEYIWPVAGTVSSGFGPRRVSVGSSNHQGIDIAAPAGTPVHAADGGEVIFSGWNGGFGNLIKIRHDNGHVTYYAHLSSIDVSTGQFVYRGQFIGRVGMTGTASGNHLHFEIRINGVPVDPMLHLP